MPFEVYLLWNQYPWNFGHFACDTKMLTTEAVTYSSIFTIVAFTVERYHMKNDITTKEISTHKLTCILRTARCVN